MDQDPTPSHAAPDLSPIDPAQSERPPMRSVGQGPRPPRSVAGLWVALGILCYLIFGLQLMNHAGPDTLPDPAKFSSVQLKLMGRYVVGAKAWGVPIESVAHQIDGIAATNVIDRFRAVIVISEVLGPKAALERLDELDPLLLESDQEQYLALREDSALLRRELTIAAAQQPEPAPKKDEPAEAADSTPDAAPADAAPDAAPHATPDAAPAQEAAIAAPEPLTDAERQRLIDRHGWFGELALVQVPGADAKLRAAIESGGLRAMIALICFAVIAGVAILAGFSLFIVALVMLGSGRVRPMYTQMRARFPLHGNASLESAVLFLGLFIGIQVVMGLLSLAVDVESFAKPLTLILMWLVALVAFWPLFRGVSFAQLRAANGWHANGAGFGGILREMAMGVVGYLAGLPIVIGGALLTFLLMALTSAETTHPIQGEVEVHSLAEALYLYVLAVIWAPLVEESIFRGALFHSVRRWTGLLASACVTAFAFAIIHPQGYAGVPVLMALALNFAMMREWRGSLIPSMTAHALHNGMLITMLVLVLA